MDLDDDELRKTRVAKGLEEKNADEMFEEMGYKKVVDNSDCCIYDLENEFRIRFNKKNNMQLFIVELTEKSIIENMTNDIYLQLDEIQAIYKKCEELRMDIMSKEKIINSIAFQQATIEELKEIRKEVSLSATEDIRIKIEIRHWYGYSEPLLRKGKHKLETDKYTMQQILDEAINQAQGRINKLIDMEIERRERIKDE